MHITLIHSTSTLSSSSGSSKISHSATTTGICWTTLRMRKRCVPVSTTRQVRPLPGPVQPEQHRHCQTSNPPLVFTSSLPSSKGWWPVTSKTVPISATPPVSGLQYDMPNCRLPLNSLSSCTRSLSMLQIKTQSECQRLKNTAWSTACSTVSTVRSNLKRSPLLAGQQRREQDSVACLENGQWNLRTSRRKLTSSFLVGLPVFHCCIQLCCQHVSLHAQTQLPS